MGFTNHDLDLTFDSVTYQAESGMSGSELEESLGLSVDNMDVEGMVDSEDITEADIAAGKYDNAIVDIYAVNWADVSQRVLIKTGRLGEISRGETGFIAEFRGLAAELQQEVGRTYQYKCDAVVGDARCGFNLDQPAFKGVGTVVASTGRNAFTTTSLSSFDNAWFTDGVLTWTSGGNNGRSIEVRTHLSGGVQSIILWAPMAADIETGDSFSITAGCDKTFRTCKAKFANPVNFRGFPHMPEDEFVIQYPNRGDPGLDGGGRFNGAD